MGMEGGKAYRGDQAAFENLWINLLEVGSDPTCPEIVESRWYGPSNRCKIWLHNWRLTIGGGSKKHKEKEKMWEIKD